jgi:hypothetical protein
MMLRMFVPSFHQGDERRGDRSTTTVRKHFETSPEALVHHLGDEAHERVSLITRRGFAAPAAILDSGRPTGRVSGN